jgi:hypothetical protein
MNNTTGILVRVSFGKFAPKVQNKKAAAEYAAQHGSANDMHKAHMLLVSDEHTKPIQAFENYVRANVVNVLTIPWDRGGSSLLPAKCIDKFMSQISKLRYEHDALVADWLAKYDDIIEEAKAKLNGDFNAARYPSREEVSKKFTMSVSYSPLPDSGDYRIDVSKELMDEVAAETKRDAESRFDAARVELRQRLIDKLEHLADRCKAMNDNDKSKWYGSNLSNLEELIELMPDMMLGDDPTLESALVDARKIIRNVDSDTIKASETIRNDVRKRAAEIVSALQF